MKVEEKIILQNYLEKSFHIVDMRQARGYQMELWRQIHWKNEVWQREYQELAEAKTEENCIHQVEATRQQDLATISHEEHHFLILT